MSNGIVGSDSLMWCCADFLQSDNVIASKADTMVETITHIDQDYGGVRGYCKAIGLLDEEIARIRTNFMKQVITCKYLNPSYCRSSLAEGHALRCISLNPSYCSGSLAEGHALRCLR